MGTKRGGGKRTEDRNVQTEWKTRTRNDTRTARKATGRPTGTQGYKPRVKEGVAREPQGGKSGATGARKGRKRNRKRESKRRNTEPGTGARKKGVTNR